MRHLYTPPLDADNADAILLLSTSAPGKLLVQRCLGSSGSHAARTAGPEAQPSSRHDAHQSAMLLVVDVVDLSNRCQSLILKRGTAVKQ